MHIQLPPDAPFLLRFAADSVLTAHIGGGVVGIVAGGTALAARKGRPLHRTAGKVFVAAMLVAYLVGAAAAPFIHQPANVIGGLFAAYLVATGWLTARTPPGKVGAAEKAGFVAAATTAVVMSVFAWFGAHNPHGIDGVPWQAGLISAVLGAFAAGLDFKVIRAGGLFGPARTARHVWRMCVGLFSGAASFFIGQPNVFPPPLHGSPLLFVPPLLVLVLMIYWLVRIRVRPRKPAAVAA